MLLRLKHLHPDAFCIIMLHQFQAGIFTDISHTVKVILPLTFYHTWGKNLDNFQNGIISYN